MVRSAIFDFSRIGANRDLKEATEAYWGGKLSQADLLAEAKRLRLEHWKIQKKAGVDVIPSSDFALWDQVLCHIQDLGCVPERYANSKLDAVDEYFAMAFDHQKGGVRVPSLEMVKRSDSNDHYVPTLQDNQTFKLAAHPKAVAEFTEAKEAGIPTRPVLVGPVSFLHLAKADHGQTVDPIDLLDKLLPVYEELLTKLKAAGAEVVQIDEPVLVFDLPAKTKAAFEPTYKKFVGLGDKIPKLVFATYFGDIVHNLEALPKDMYAVHVDGVRSQEQLETVIGALGPKTILSAGVVDGRNIWKTNMKREIEAVETTVQKLGQDRVMDIMKRGLGMSNTSLRPVGDLLLFDVNNKTLHKEISKRARLPYLKTANGKFTMENGDVCEGFVYGKNNRIILTLAVARDTKSMPLWIHFIVDTGSPKTYLAQKAWKQLNLVECEWSMVGGRKLLVEESPSHIHDVSVLGMDAIRAWGMQCDFNHENNTVIFYFDMPTGKKGLDIDAKDKYGLTLLSRASERGHIAVVDLVLKNGADTEADDHSGLTPLTRAAMSGHKDIVRLLLEMDANIEAKDTYGLTPLLWATVRGYEDIVRLLLELDADIEEKDTSGLTPLLYAEKGYDDIVRLLCEKHADIKAKDTSGMTPLLYAAKERYEVIVRLLRDAAVVYRRERA
ncbi:cobalamin-independent synthase [Hyaloscypha sp. PMI_1271]|nr:cobalamin-independent synthase [Hyaloscypha sp. PMI_1271]